MLVCTADWETVRHRPIDVRRYAYGRSITVKTDGEIFHAMRVRVRSLKPQPHRRIITDGQIFYYTAYSNRSHLYFSSRRKAKIIYKLVVTLAPSN